MTGPDDEFEDFLRRRKPIFRAPDDMFEPPAEIDRIVLRQAREAIETRKGPREIRGMAWGAPLALAASLLVAFTILLNIGVKHEAVPEVTIEHVAQRRDLPPPQFNYPMAGTQAEPARGTVLTDVNPGADARRAAPAPGLVSQQEAARYAPPPPPPVVVRERGAASADTAAGPAESTVVVASPPPSVAESAVAKASGTPTWRHDAGSWLAEIQRLRAEGKNAEADAELAEYKRQHKAYAGSPDR